MAPIIPWSGFLISSFIAWLAKLPKNQILTIAIETGIQNVGIAFLIIFSNFPSPESDYAILPLISVTSFTTIPLWLFLIFKILRKKGKFCLFKKDEDEDSEKKQQTVSVEEIVQINKNDETSKLNVESNEETKVNLNEAEITLV